MKEMMALSDNDTERVTITMFKYLKKTVIRK